MTRGHPTLVVAVLLLSPAPLLGQSLSPDRCDEPRVPLGILSGQGAVRYHLAADGRPDTASVRVARVRGISAGGYRSAVVRELSACRMKRLHDQRSGLDVLQAISFTGAKGRTTIQMAPAVVDTAADSSLASAPVLEVNPGPRVRDDSTVEEHPRYLSCGGGSLPALGGPPSGPFRSREEADAAFNAWAQQHSGRVRLQAVVGSDGRISRDSVQVVETTNVSVTNEGGDAISACRYTPGRIGGVPVPTRIELGRSYSIELAP